MTKEEFVNLQPGDVIRLNREPFLYRVTKPLRPEGSEVARFQVQNTDTGGFGEAWLPGVWSLVSKKHLMPGSPINFVPAPVEPPSRCHCDIKSLTSFGHETSCLWRR